MASKGVPDLLEALFIYGKAGGLDSTSKAALRLCNKHFKNLVDATVTDAMIESDNLEDSLDHLINTNWYGLKELTLIESGADALSEVPSALFVKFSRLETLCIMFCTYLDALCEEIGELSHLKSLDIYHCESLGYLPASLGKLTALEKITLSECRHLTSEGIAPLQHLTGLTALTLQYCRDLVNYPEFICNLTSLKELQLYSVSIDTLPDALGYLTNLESLDIHLGSLEELPESIGNLNALKALDLCGCFELAALPESLDDLMWRQAHVAGELKMELIDFRNCTLLALSPKMEHALELLKQNGVTVRWLSEY